jgi:uncharacterized iron-regulated membrane protein
MAWLHTWVGLLPGWLLFVIFLFGTTAFFQQEISRWMRPELASAPATKAAVIAATRYLSVHAPDAANWTISLPAERGADALSVSWQPPKESKGAAGEAKLDPTNGREIAIRETRGGAFLYRFHFDLHYMPIKWARILVSAAALAMLVAILSGIVTHKKIFAHFFLLRFGKGQRSWLDAHNVTAVLALPFHLMITYTGLVTLLFTLMPWAISANFPSQAAFNTAAYPPPPTIEASGAPAVLLPMRDLIVRAETALGGAKPSYISVTHPGDAAAVAGLWPPRDRLGSSRDPVYLSGVTGEVLQLPPHRGGADTTRGVMVDLHTGLFADMALRWLYFLSGVSGTVMVATGLVLWTVKRRAKLPDPARPHVGFRLVERLNIGVIAGAPAGIAVYFLANRLLPLSMGNRADWEINSLFIAWGGVFAWALTRTARRAWIETLVVCAMLYVLVPVVNAVTTARGIIPSLAARDWVFVSFDLTMLATAGLFAFTARKVARHNAATVGRRRTVPNRVEAGA